MLFQARKWWKSSGNAPRIQLSANAPLVGDPVRKEKPPEWIPSDLNPKRILTMANGGIVRRSWYGDYWDEAEGTDLEVYADALRAGMDRHRDIEANIDMQELRRLLPDFDLDETCEE